MPLRSSESRYFATNDGVKLHSLHWSGAIDASPAEVDDNAVDAPPTILLHGGGANAHWWDHLAPTLAKEGPIFALDFRGHGDSDFPSDREVGAFNVDLEEMLNWLGRKDVHLIGHSLGAAVAFDHASRHPQTRSISLIDLARGSTKGSGRRARLALALRRTYLSRAEAIERFRFLPESSQHNEELRRRIAQMSVREEPDGSGCLPAPAQIPGKSAARPCSSEDAKVICSPPPPGANWSRPYRRANSLKSQKPAITC